MNEGGPPPRMLRALCVPLVLPTGWPGQARLPHLPEETVSIVIFHPG